jgi:hypothetical protein
MAALGGLFFVGMIYVASLFIARDPKQIHGAYLLNPGLLRLRGIFGSELSVRR